MKIKTAPLRSFSEHDHSFNHYKSMDTKVPNISPSRNKPFIHVLVGAFSNSIVTIPTNCDNAKTAVKTLLSHWIVNFGPPIYLVTDGGSEYVNADMAHLCTLMALMHSPITPYSPWTTGPLKFKMKILAHIFVCYFTKHSQELGTLHMGNYIYTLLHIIVTPFCTKRFPS